MGKDSAVTITEAEVCSHCGKEPRALGHRWCAPCKAEAQRRYDTEREKMIEARGFAAGVSAMRSVLLAGMLNAHPAAVLKVGEFANYVSSTPVPTRSQPVADSQGG
jgi:hypothetical protein